MKHKKTTFCATLFLASWIANVHAQQTATTSGGLASGSGGSVSYSIGQVFYNTNAGINGSIGQGVQQPYEISVITALENTKRINLEYIVYPNPTTDYAKLKVENFNSENLTYQLYDINGKNIENKKIISSETNIVLNNLVPATYFLKVTHGNIVLKIFKIIKN